MKNMTNATHIEGFLYQHTLEKKVTGPNSKHPGTEYVSGNIDIATDDELVNIVTVHFSYITKTVGKEDKKKDDSRWPILVDIIDGRYKTVVSDGVENATRLAVDSAIDLNEFYSDRDGTDTLVSAKRNEGGFIRILNSISSDENSRNTFKVDMVITKVTEVEPDAEKDTPAKAIVRGVIFNFRKDILPVEFSAYNPGAIKYFTGLDASSKNPVFTSIWGHQVSQTKVNKVTEQSAFGEDYVREYRSVKRDWVISGANKTPYEWDDESTILASELAEAMANRETYLATLKTNREAYLANRNTKATAAKAATSEFNF